MALNLTPQYKKAEEWFKSATTHEEKLLALEEMLRIIPKHKASEHMQSDLKKKIKALKEQPAKKTGGQADIFHIPKSGAGQVVLLGTPNSGKSSIPALLTNANVTVADYPFSTTAPIPGMVQFEEIKIQLVDMPPISEEIMMPGQVGTYRNCDLIAIVIDVSGDVEKQWEVLMDFLVTRKLLIDAENSEINEEGNNLGRKAFVIATKIDAAGAGAIEKLKELVAERFEIYELSTETMEGIEGLPAKFFKLLNVIRIYSKPPGKDPDMKDPFVLPVGSTVQDLAKSIHRDLAEKIKTARVWGTGVHDGQSVQRTHVLHDKDIVALHV